MASHGGARHAKGSKPLLDGEQCLVLRAARAVGRGADVPLSEVVWATGLSADEIERATAPMAKVKNVPIRVRRGLTSRLVVEPPGVNPDHLARSEARLRAEPDISSGRFAASGSGLDDVSVSPQECALLRAASGNGGVFDASVVGRLFGYDGDAQKKAVADLKRRGFPVEERDGSFGGYAGAFGAGVIASG